MEELSKQMLDYELIQKLRHIELTGYAYNSHEENINQFTIYPKLQESYEIKSVRPKHTKVVSRNKKSLGGFSKNTRLIRFKEENGICEYCHLPILEGHYEAHHIIPISKGGDNSPSNLMVLHKHCHKSPTVFFHLHGFYQNDLTQKSKVR